MTSVEKKDTASPSDVTVSLSTELSKSSLTEQKEPNTTDSSGEVKIDKEKAEEFKELGNQAFREGHYALSIEHYTKAIEFNPKEASYYGNRSFAYLRSEFYGYALADANKAIELDSRYIKGYYRRASANLALGKFKLALKDYEFVVKVCPDDRDAQNKYKECDKINRRIAFEKAIAIDESLMKKSALDQIDIEHLRRSNIEHTYAGPKLTDDHRVTPEFVTELMEYFKQQKVLHKKYAYEILFQIHAYFKQASTLVDITVPDGQKFTICGDVHGQFYDLMNIFKINGMPSETNPYLFNGDFVDRGSFSIEVIFTLFALKLCYPNHFFLARGNHESITMNQMYGFEGECKSKYTQQMFGVFTEIFNYLPLCHLINSRVLCMHGGLFSRDSVKLDDLRAIDRNRQPPEEGLMCDLMWSDPQYAPGRSQSKRGVGIQFGPDVTQEFCRLNNIDYIVRSHEVKQEGYECMHGDKCITVFSAPNYCDQMGNKGALINLTGSSKRDVPMAPKFVTFDAVEHPQIKPMAYANAFSMFGLA